MLALEENLMTVSRMQAVFILGCRCFLAQFLGSRWNRSGKSPLPLPVSPKPYATSTSSTGMLGNIYIYIYIYIYRLKNDCRTFIALPLRHLGKKHDTRTLLDLAN